MSDCQYERPCVAAAYAMERCSEYEELAANANPGPLEVADRDIALLDLTDAQLEANTLPPPPTALLRCGSCILNMIEFKDQEGL